MEGAGTSTVVGTRRIIEAVGAGEVGEEEGLGMEAMEEVYTLDNILKHIYNTLYSQYACMYVYMYVYSVLVLNCLAVGHCYVISSCSFISIYLFNNFFNS